MYTNELYHHGVKGMKWGVRKTPEQVGGSITRNGKYRASNGIVIAKSKNLGAKLGRRFTVSATGSALSAFGSLGLNKKQKERIKKERAALKEYYKVGGDRLLKEYGNMSYSDMKKKISD